MANMPYCRFRNTLEDLRDCQEELGELNDLEQITSPEEKRAAKALIKMCGEIASDWEGELQ